MNFQPPFVKAQLLPMIGNLRYQELEYRGRELTFAKHRRANPKTIVEALQNPNALDWLPKGNRRKSWWGAQARLYGLKGKDWSIDECRKVLQEALSKGPLDVPSSLKEAEERLNKEYERRVEEAKREATEKDEKYQAATTDQEKARIDLERLLKEKFREDTCTLFVLRDCGSDYDVQKAARHLGFKLHCSATRELLPPRTSIVAVARDFDTANGERQRIDGENVKVKAAIDDAKWAGLTGKRQELVSRDGDGGSPAGHWVLHMPMLYDYNNWDRERDCIIDLPSFNPTDETVYASFQFVEFVGWLKIDFSKVKEDWRGAELNVEWEGHAELECDGDEYDLDTRHVAAITFASASECHGTIDGWFGAWEFKGVKVSAETDVAADECKEKFELEKQRWDELRSNWFDDTDPKNWYKEEEELEESVMSEIEELRP